MLQPVQAVPRTAFRIACGAIGSDEPIRYVATMGRRAKVRETDSCKLDLAMNMPSRGSLQWARERRHVPADADRWSRAADMSTQVRRRSWCVRVAPSVYQRFGPYWGGGPSRR